MTYLEVIEKWRALPEEQQRELRWSAIPQQVAESMAFEGEPVDVTWLKSLHPHVVPLLGSKTAAEYYFFAQVAPLFEGRLLRTQVCIESSYG